MMKSATINTTTANSKCSMNESGKQHQQNETNKKLAHNIRDKKQQNVSKVDFVIVLFLLSINYIYLFGLIENSKFTQQ